MQARQNVSEKEEMNYRISVNDHLILMVKKENIEAERVMTPFEEALHSGMFFENGELMEVVCDKKSQHSDVIHREGKYILSTQAFGDIPVANMLKIKIYANRIPNKVCLKIDEEGQRQPHIFHLQKQQITQLFSKLIWVKLATMNIFVQLESKYQSQIEGQALCSCGPIERWERNTMSISKQRGLLLTSTQKKRTSLKTYNLNEFWTRFQMINSQAYLVVKLWSGIFKYEIGIPVSPKVTEWMQAFCSILKQS